jgi:UDP-N-acetylglucosamine transferase subunit ALG13
MDQPRTSLKTNILIAPLDWGLGHATRCIPLIRRLILRNCSVFLACEGRIKVLLQNEFPQLNFVDLRGYDISYAKNAWSLPFVITGQIPKILSAIQYENKRLKEIVEEHRIDGVISDNRYGFYHDSVPSVFMTHQLLIKTGMGKLVDEQLQQINYKYINHFSECWIPDHEDEPNLAGALAHPEKKPDIPVNFLGPLSRFRLKENSEAKHLLIMLSGPEPQRTIFEELLIAQLPNYKDPVVLVRGLPGENNLPELPSNISVFNHLSSEELNRKMAEASIVIARCGYSTVMDLAVMTKKSILVPTPGQAEQEYLASHLMKSNFAFCIDQHKFKLKNALELAENFDFHVSVSPNNFGFEKTLDSFISSSHKAE